MKNFMDRVDELLEENRKLRQRLQDDKDQLIMHKNVRNAYKLDENRAAA